MQLGTRAFGLATLAALAAAVVLFEPGREPTLAAAAQPAELPADLALVPADAAGFVHVRAADLWKHEALAQFRQIVEKAGPKALGTLDQQFVPKISTFDRATAFLLLDGERMQPLPFLVLRFTAPFDVDEVAKAYLGAPETFALAGKAVYGSKNAEFGLYFPDKQHIVVSNGAGFKAYFKHELAKTGPLAPALKLAATGKPVVASVNLASIPLPPKLLEDLPPDVKLLLKAEHVTVSLDLGAAAKIELTAGYTNAADAEKAEKAIKALAEFARKELAKVKEDVEKKFFEAKGPRPAHDLPEALFSVFALGALNHVDDLLANPGAYIKRDGATLAASVTVPKELLVSVGGLAGVGAGLLLPAVQKTRVAAARMQSQNNLKQIGIAIHNYHDTFGHFPQDIVDKNGKPMLSWRVAILPFIEQDAIYRQFKMDEPWDSPNNKKLSQLTIRTFLAPNAVQPNIAGMTNYQGLVGPGTMFEAGKKLKFADVTDGSSNTIFVVETAELVEWAKPGGIAFDPKKPLPKLPSVTNNDMINVLLGDGSVRTVNTKTVAEKTLKNAIIRNDGEPLGSDW